MATGLVSNAILRTATFRDYWLAISVKSVKFGRVMPGQTLPRPFDTGLPLSICPKVWLYCMKLYFG